jgi:hypothetical protein
VAIHINSPSALRCVDPRRKCRPITPAQVKVDAQIQQRALLDGVALAHHLDKAMGEVRFSGLAVAGIGCGE